MRLLLLACTLYSALSASAQYKNDNIAFKTVYIEDLCQRLQSTPDAVIVDVRSKGEYYDTSATHNLNIGHLRNAIHLDIREMPARWRELLPYKDQPVFVVCSHSQRSRRVSKMLADSGFTNITNINGGLTTYNLLAASLACSQQLVTANKHKTVSPLDLCGFLNANKDVFILDLRNDSAYRGIIADERQNAAGTLKGSVNIPLVNLANSLHKVPAGKKILLVDDFGNESVQAAKLLADKGYNDVHVLFNGLDMLMSRTNAEVPCMKDRIARTVSYQPLSIPEFYDRASKGDGLVILDVRAADEFTNQSKQAFRNVGRIKNAINIPAADLETRIKELDAHKNQPLAVYGWTSNPEVFKAARYLADHGFRKVYVIPGGLANVRWQAANYKGRAYLNQLVIDVPPENQ